MFTIFDCLTKQRVSDRSYATAEEANHDYYMNQGHTYIGVIAQHSSPAQPTQDEASSAPQSRPLEGSGLAAQHAEGPNVSAVPKLNLVVLDKLKLAMAVYSNFDRDWFLQESARLMVLFFHMERDLATGGAA